jgi:hypothetical protein
LIAFADGLKQLRAPKRWATAAFVLSAIVLVAFSPLHPLHYLKPSYHALADARAVLGSIPPDAHVATHDEWYTAISAHDPNASVLGTGPRSIAAPYIVFAEDFPNEDFQHRLLPQIHGALQAGNYTLVARHGAVSAWKAGPAGTHR